MSVLGGETGDTGGIDEDDGPEGCTVAEEFGDDTSDENAADYSYIMLTFAPEIEFLIHSIDIGGGFVVMRVPSFIYNKVKKEGYGMEPPSYMFNHKSARALPACYPLGSAAYSSVSES